MIMIKGSFKALKSLFKEKVITEFTAAFHNKVHLMHIRIEYTEGNNSEPLGNPHLEIAWKYTLDLVFLYDCNKKKGHFKCRLFSKAYA